MIEVIFLCDAEPLFTKRKRKQKLVVVGLPCDVTLKKFIYSTQLNDFPESRPFCQHFGDSACRISDPVVYNVHGKAAFGAPMNCGWQKVLTDLSMQPFSSSVTNLECWTEALDVLDNF